ncbi:MAG TPA: AAA family ATPase [Nitrososphaeraceae archaeon]|nr:AAA family ATPase [Nitrososphaeraceae archaeon]
MKNQMRLAITGNPGVGKHTTTRFLCAKLEGLKIIDINKIIIDNNAFLLNDEEYGKEVDIKKTLKLMRYELKNGGDLVIIGHLVPYVLKPDGIDLVVVMRRSPYEIIKTFEDREYSPEKIRENIASEILGISFYDALKTFGKNKVIEFDATGKTPQQSAEEIVSLLQNKLNHKIGMVDWLSLVYEKGDVQKFLEYY